MPPWSRLAVTTTMPEPLEGAEKRSEREAALREVWKKWAEEDRPKTITCIRPDGPPVRYITGEPSGVEPIFQVTYKRKPPEPLADL
jgi:hypothetical protein